MTMVDLTYSQINVIIQYSTATKIKNNTFSVPKHFPQKLSDKNQTFDQVLKLKYQIYQYIDYIFII